METDALVRFVRQGAKHGATTRRSGISIPRTEALVRVLQKHTDQRISDVLIQVVEVVAGQVSVGDKFWVQLNELEPCQASAVQGGP